MAKTPRINFTAIFLAMLMATISLSASISSWDWQELELEEPLLTTSNINLDTTLGHSVTIPTNIVGDPATGSYETSTGLDGMRFTSKALSFNQSISFYSQHMCFISDTLELKCSGYNGYGQLGNGESYYGYDESIVDFGNDRYPISVSSGLAHTCVILDNGELKCWGRNT